MSDITAEFSRQSGANFRQLGVIDPPIVGDSIAAFLRQRHPMKTAACVAAATGVPVATVEKWLERGSAPSSAAFIALLQAYGPDFLVAVCPRAPKWLSSAWRAERLRQLEADMASLDETIGGGR